MRALLLMIILLTGAYACKDNNLRENQDELLPYVTSDETSSNEILVSEFTEPLVANYEQGRCLIAISISDIFFNSDGKYGGLIYWNYNNNIYYIGEIIKKSPKKLLNFDEVRHRNHFLFHHPESPDGNVLKTTKYLGAISSNCFVYSSDQYTYIVNLKIIDDTFIELWDDENLVMVPVTNTYTFYPKSSSLYTNENGRIFWRGGQNFRLQPI